MNNSDGTGASRTARPESRTPASGGDWPIQYASPRTGSTKHPLDQRSGRTCPFGWPMLASSSGFPGISLKCSAFTLRSGIAGASIGIDPREWRNPSSNGWLLDPVLYPAPEGIASGTDLAKKSCTESCRLRWASHDLDISFFGADRETGAFN